MSRRIQMGAGDAAAYPAVSPPPSLPDTFELSPASSGGWTQVQLERAVHHTATGVDVTVYGYHDGQSGNNELRLVDHLNDDAVSAPFVLKAGIGGIEGSPDSHAAPVFLVLPDGRLRTYYSGHATSELWTRVTTNPLPDITAWGAEVNLDAELGKGLYTYPSAFHVGSDVWLFFRDTQGTPGGASETSVMCWAVSDDGAEGGSFGSAVELFKRANFLPYWVIDSDGSRVDVHLIDGYPFGSSESPVKGHHFGFWAGAWRRSDGTAIASAQPYGIADLTEIYDAADGNAGSPYDVHTNGGNPVILQHVQTGSDHRIDYKRWNGSVWVTTTMAQTSWAGNGGQCFDSADPNVVYHSKLTGSGILEIFRYETADTGATFSNEQITTDSPVHNSAPVRVRNRATGLRALWMRGNQASYLDYSVGTWGARV